MSFLLSRYPLLTTLPNVLLLIPQSTAPDSHFQPLVTFELTCLNPASLELMTFFHACAYIQCTYPYTEFITLDYICFLTHISLVDNELQLMSEGRDLPLILIT